MAKTNRNAQPQQQETENFYDVQEFLGEYQKSEKTKVRISYVEKKFEDEDTPPLKGIDIREWVSRKGQPYTPAKGIVVRVENAAEFFELMDSAKAYLSELSAPKQKKSAVKKKPKAV